ncbi:MAG: response regulator [Pirellulales bacterium]|nr:response regulator [Pirellulales bacterium]
MPNIQLLLVGDFERGEFRESVALLKSTAEVESAADVDRAEAAMVSGRIAPEAIVVAQAYPGRFSHDEIDRLRRAAPLARIIGLMGTWCEGEMRTGQPWASNGRLYWHQWPACCRRQLGRLSEGKPCSWALPPTATDEERLLTDICSTPPQASEGPGVKTGGLAVIRCRRFEAWDWFRAACRSVGLSAVWHRGETLAPMEGVKAAVFDCDELNEAEIDELQRFSAAVRPAPAIVLASFPRIEDYDRALAAGASAVLSKPVTVDEVFTIITATK